ncbi:ABC transporter permease, partial [Cronobacter sakazakii]
MKSDRLTSPPSPRGHNASWHQRRRRVAWGLVLPSLRLLVLEAG